MVPTGWCVLGVRADGGTDTWCIDLLPEMIVAYPQPGELNVEFVMNEKEGPSSKRKRTDDSSSSEEEDIYIVKLKYPLPLVEKGVWGPRANTAYSNL